LYILNFKCRLRERFFSGTHFSGGLRCNGDGLADGEVRDFFGKIAALADEPGKYPKEVS